MQGRQQRSQNVIMTLAGDVTPSVRKNLSVDVAVMDLLPALSLILQPSLRPVGTASPLFCVNVKMMDCVSPMVTAFAVFYGVLAYTLQVNTQLYSAKEKRELLNLIDIMIAYNINFHQHRSDDGQYTYQLEP